jgi:hypothetical protein
MMGDAPSGSSESNMSAVLSDLDNAIGNLNGTAENLVKRINPLLMEEDSAKSQGEDAPDSPSGTTVRTLKVYAERVKGIQRMLANATGRLDI